MGSSGSKAVNENAHVFHAETPIRFSESLVGSLQESRESDSTRAKQLELQVQKRVQEELEKLHKSGADRLKSVSDATSQQPFEPTPTKHAPSPDQKYSWTEKPLFDRIGELIFGSSDSDKPAFNPNLDRSSVNKEIEDLRERFASRKHVIELDKDVAKAKEDLVTCLRLHDRKPLDCWKEVETFKAEAGRLEKAFVDKNGI